MSKKKTASRIFVISAPSGTGKTTLAQELKKRIPGLELVISYTTKKPRPEEKNGMSYHFIDKAKFLSMIENNAFAEWAEVYENYYGTPKKEIADKLSQSWKILLTINTQGGMSIKKKFPEAVLIAVMPPSIKEQEKRIRSRKGLSEKEIKERMDSDALKEKAVLMKEYDFRLINKNLKNTIRKICNIINKGSKY